MDFLAASSLLTVRSLVAISITGVSSTSADASFVETGTPPACPAGLFDEELVTVTCHQGGKDQLTNHCSTTSVGKIRSGGRGFVRYDDAVSGLVARCSLVVMCMQ